MILVTGSSGVVGRRLCAHLQRAGLTVRQFDIRRSPNEGVCIAGVVEQALADRVSTDGSLELEQA